MDENAESSSVEFCVFMNLRVYLDAQMDPIIYALNFNGVRLVNRSEAYVNCAGTMRVHWCQLTCCEPDPLENDNCVREAIRLCPKRRLVARCSTCYWTEGLRYVQHR